MCTLYHEDDKGIKKMWIFYKMAYHDHFAAFRSYKMMSTSLSQSARIFSFFEML